jgi:molybdopterin/thiamine biosynthesis adenylyltransferase
MSTDAQDIVFLNTTEHSTLINEFTHGGSGRYLNLLDSMLEELTLNKYPKTQRGTDEFRNLIIEERNKKKTRVEGVFVLYPWSNTLLRILDEEDFVFLRTVRNRNKIRANEQEILNGKSIGIIGLSVGYSVLMAMALERVASNFKIADFDEIELSNLNRIYQPLTNIGINKAVAAKRAVLELDPYISIEIFTSGINQDNIQSFLTEGKKLDLLVDECDSGYVKYISRFFARMYGIPVLMETSDRGVLDIERYDLDGNYPLLHGRFSEFVNEIDELKKLDRELLLASIDFSKVSERGIESMGLIGKEIRTWPQLGTDVLSGGATLATAARKILLGMGIQSSRNYIDIESRIN